MVECAHNDEAAVREVLHLRLGMLVIQQVWFHGAPHAAAVHF